ncbi:MAG: hypothetical protein UX88_C0021G0005 [Candidatus Woesebacteria bacterium GW2011_GWC2_47_16]|uniref:DUF1648 domain-containing protein n=7 Tax=Candidatus Woeseibacteriota TaxID=1752722 RepID=A0A0G1TTJ8_9BACT|nr:MAG: hypothetical protein UX03_C0039G0009 [Candidatus Woesebacteria bacterium GW2011_GWE1_45_18]KKU22012.1 MAG: hypothetical protein UX34_C0034G0007 [Candidatus Woesebacteria bacterium GW2011_GWF1_46_13]KKU48700.1 MAG: hypothetical protein UX67_C0011G0004 [Candidatus Woesebacteria bacterium GW2011_GWF2_46_8]KKU63834.1 MAG: hypothetical protein UX88_C0021G0005 [Candidatus Woesebacteria bacterium GW2011_GWC2_47_16]OGM83323.1 MAG: hypothetical protein A2376_01000 [Candidatus Woesebacteria bacte
MKQVKIGKFEVGTLPFKNYAVAAFLVNILVIFSVVLAQRFLPPEVPLFYGLAEGEEQLAPRLFLLIPSLASLVVLILNSLVSSRVEDIFIKKALVIAAIGTTFFAAITTLKIMFLVGSF